MPMTDVAGKWVYLSGPDGYPDGMRARARVLLAAMGAHVVFDPKSVCASTGWGKEARTLYALHELTSVRFPSGTATPVFELVALMEGWKTDLVCREEAAVAQACGIETEGIWNILGDDWQDLGEEQR